MMMDQEGKRMMEDFQERYDERAAIAEYDGGLERVNAEQAALLEVREYALRHPMKDSVRVLKTWEARR